jgi:predicted ATPase
MYRGLCHCSSREHDCRFVVLTGGPGAGKTAVLAVVRRHFCEHVAVLPEAASIVFGGGFPRAERVAARRAAQRAIYSVQVELERMVLEERIAAVALCDRGTLDGLAYWPGHPESFFADVGTDPSAMQARYAAVIHLRTPPPERGYNHRNPLRGESALEAAQLDERVAEAWSHHPRRVFVDSTDDFLDKLATTIALVRNELPPCCRTHEIPEVAATRLGSVPPVRSNPEQRR